ncbi:MAG: hypothetical protein OXE81_06840 [Gammaproteobacteria bacterium]|nr:hypothetical protein [Gammaproteobacteria bacterium]
MSIDTTFLRRCIGALERALDGMEKHRVADDVLYEVFRAACVKELDMHATDTPVTALTAQTWPQTRNFTAPRPVQPNLCSLVKYPG